MIIAVMSAISVTGRALFVITPGFKPVAAIAAITGFSLGAEAGFLTGAISALVSNMFFGQGPWTPFQMFMWGMIGFIGGLLGRTGIMHKKIPLILFGIFAGILFSFGMDIWGTMSLYGVFSMEAYIVALTSAVPFTIVYAVSNVIFLLILARPIREKLERINNKYGTFQ
ncbi:ECF transporter S component [Solibacillus merdavium]|uniref:ECF transporter S component n=1 Tax=Solibacillus merdavium TaxID=2762218 RepID=UPI0021E55DE4|nr:ECF transporter S component [Solibacillus merdavium]